MSNRLGSNLDEKILLRELTQQFLHNKFTMGSNGGKNWGDTFSVHCVYIGLKKVFCPAKIEICWHSCSHGNMMGGGVPIIYQ